MKSSLWQRHAESAYGHTGVNHFSCGSESFLVKRLVRLTLQSAATGAEAVRQSVTQSGTLSCAKAAGKMKAKAATAKEGRIFVDVVQWNQQRSEVAKEEEGLGCRQRRSEWKERDHFLIRNGTFPLSLPT